MPPRPAAAKARRRPDTGSLDVKLTTPKEMGGSGRSRGRRPEQLFAAGYSACFIGAMKYVAMTKKIALPAETSIDAEVGIGPIPQGFGIQVALHVHVPGMDKDEAMKRSRRPTRCARTRTRRAATSR